MTFHNVLYCNQGDKLTQFLTNLIIDSVSTYYITEYPQDILFPATLTLNLCPKMLVASRDLILSTAFPQRTCLKHDIFTGVKFTFLKKI